jgi:thioredoxin-like negative regulator of GroEL
VVAPVVESYAKEFDGKVKVVGMDLDQAPQTPGELGIMAIPTIIAFKNGREVTRYTGGSKEKISQLFASLS